MKGEPLAVAAARAYKAWWELWREVGLLILAAARRRIAQADGQISEWEEEAAKCGFR